MKTLQLNNREYLFVPVPEDARDFYIIWDRLGSQKGRAPIKNPTLPSGSWSIIGTTAKVLQSEELAKEIVEVHEGTSYWDDSNEKMYINYKVTDENPMVSFSYALDSFRTLLEHHNIPHSIILVKQ